MTNEMKPVERVNCAFKLFEKGLLDTEGFLDMAGITISPELRERLPNRTSVEDVSNMLQNLLLTTALVQGLKALEATQ